MSVDLSVEFAGIKFKNPTIAAAAPPTRDLKCVIKAIESGIGGVVPKTMTYEESARTKPHPEYLLVYWRTIEAKELEKQIPPYYLALCRDGPTLCPWEPEEYVKQLKEMKKQTEKADVRLIGSIMGRTEDEWIKLAKLCEEAEVDAIELDLSCPSTWLHTKKLAHAMDIAQSPELVFDLVKALKKSVSLPIIPKLTLQAANPMEVAKAAKEAGADGVTMFNILYGLVIDIEKGAPVAGGPATVGGPWAKPLVLRWIALTAKQVSAPISGCYGVHTWKDAVEYIMAGASTVQYASVIMRVGYGITKEILEGMKEFMIKKGYKKIDDFRGIILDKLFTSYQDYVKAQRPLVAVVDTKKCAPRVSVCGRCERICFKDAIKRKQIDEKTYAARVDRTKCIGCHACEYICPAKAISMEERPEEEYIRAVMTT